MSKIRLSKEGLGTQSGNFSCINASRKCHFMRRGLKEGWTPDGGRGYLLSS